MKMALPLISTAAYKMSGWIVSFGALQVHRADSPVEKEKLT